MPKPTNFAGRDGSTGAREALRLSWNLCLEAMQDPALACGCTPPRLFESLDGQTISAGVSQCLIEIYSVRYENDAMWLQLALHGESTFNVLMRLAPDEGPKHAKAALASWLMNGADRTHIVNVA
jgi:hypothetical protein